MQLLHLVLDLNLHVLLALLHRFVLLLEALHLPQHCPLLADELVYALVELLLHAALLRLYFLQLLQDDLF